MTELAPASPTRASARAVLARLGWHVRLDAGVGLLVCLVDTLVTTRNEDFPWDARGALVLAAMGIGAAGGALLGVVQFGALLLFRRLLAPLRLSARLERVLSVAAEDREPVVGFHARVLAASSFGALALAAFVVFFRVSERIKEEELRAFLIVLAAGATVLGTLLSSATLLPLVERVVRAVDARVRLPFPRTPLFRFAWFGLVPCLLLTVPAFLLFGVKLGVVMPLFGAVLFVASVRFVALLVLALTQPIRSSPRRKRVFRALAWALGGVLLLQVVASLVTLSRHEKAGYWVTRGAVLPFVTRALQSLTDVDRDGISSWFGGRDCAPLDGRRSPAARELPDNGIDENCDGKDGQAGEGLPKVEPFSGELPAHQVRPYNVLLYIVDSLRADHLPTYGYPHDTAPALTRLGKSSWVFSKATSQSSNTALSVPSLLAGRWPDSLAWRRSTYPVAQPNDQLLPSLLRGHGYYTALIINDWVHQKLPGIQHGFERKFVAPPSVNWKSGDVVWSNTVLAMAEAKRAQKPFFLAVHVDDVHHPYLAHRGHALPTFPNADAALANYDRGIALFDRTVSLLRAHLENTGVWDDTIVIVTADHGEEFLEHGGTIHSRTCYVESVHVPLIVRVPGFQPRRVANPVALVDLYPTLLELLGFSEGAPELDGQSLLVPVLKPPLADPERPLFCSIFQMLGGRENFFIRSVRSGRHALMLEVLGNGTELYDTRQDPREQTNLANDPAHAEDLARLRGFLAVPSKGNLFEARTFQ